MRQSPKGSGITYTLATVTLILFNCRDVAGVTNCVSFHDDSSVWGTIERIGISQLIALVLIAGLAVALAIVGLRCLRAIASAVNQSRAYENRVLTSLYYNRVDEAISAADSFPDSPIAAVVSSSLRWSAPSTPVGGKSVNAAFHQALIAQTDMLRRSLWVLTTIGWSSTAVGLIGSLLGDGNSSGPPIPLCIGLGVAVPAIWLYRGLSSQADLLLFETNRMSLSIIDQIGEQLVGASVRAEWIDHANGKAFGTSVSPPESNQPAP